MRQEGRQNLLSDWILEILEVGEGENQKILEGVDLGDKILSFILDILSFK